MTNELAQLPRGKRALAWSLIIVCAPFVVLYVLARAVRRRVWAGSLYR